MKKIILAVALVLSFGLLASCSNAVYQTTSVDGDYSNAVYSASGSLTVVSTMTPVAGTGTTTTRVVTVADVPSKTKVSVSEGKNSNYVTYSITVPYSEVTTTVTGSTTSTTDKSFGTELVNIVKYGDKYYVNANNVDQEITFTEDGDVIKISGTVVVSKDENKAYTSEVKTTYNVTLTKK